MATIGIGIVTYQRLERLKGVVAAIRAHTKSKYKLVVAEDGGNDGAAEWCIARGIKVITGANRGVCWNKNRALFALQALGCDPILLLEDDCYPVRDNWELDWKIGTALFGHLAYAHPKIDPWLISGSGTATDPYVNNKATAQCSSVSGIALHDVGFLDTRFKGYGVGHAEWTSRLKKAGYGFRQVEIDARKVKANLYITGGLVGEDAPTFKDRANIARNELLFEQLKAEPTYRNPWSSEEEREIFLAEIATARISDSRYELIAADRAAGYPSFGLRHLRTYDKAFKRMFGEQRSFLRTSGWLSSLALNLPAYEGELTPWFNYSVIEILKERVKPQWRVFEYGAGYSTLWWSSKVAEVHSVEHDGNWAELVQSLCAAKRATIATRPADDNFSSAIDEVEGNFDVIVVDGHDRPGCIYSALSRLTPDGVMLVDNSNRELYREAIEWVKHQGFKELKIKGLAPMTYIAETTSFLYRANNCFEF